MHELQHQILHTTSCDYVTPEQIPLQPLYSCFVKAKHSVYPFTVRNCSVRLVVVFIIQMVTAQAERCCQKMPAPIHGENQIHFGHVGHVGHVASFFGVGNTLGGNSPHFVTLHFEMLPKRLFIFLSCLRMNLRCSPILHWSFLRRSLSGVGFTICDDGGLDEFTEFFLSDMFSASSR
jgi:hypothetical protein